MYSPHRFSSLVLLLATGLLGACSPQTDPATGVAHAQSAAPAPATQPFPQGARVDSLNGVAGHVFGQPLNAFAKLEAMALDPGDPIRRYWVPAAASRGWFSKHRREVPNQFVDFVDGQFYRFRAVGEPATLRAEAIFLFGPGLVEGSQVFWEGARTRAAYSEKVRGLGREGTLDVLSKPLEAALAAKAQAKLQADNAQ
jgi:hypothetical protein